MPNIFQFLQAIALDPHRSDSLTRAVIGLLGYVLHVLIDIFHFTNFLYSDLADAFGGQLKQFFQVDWVPHLLREARTSRHYGTTTKETARWAKEVSNG